MSTLRTKGWKTVLILAWPLIISNAFWNLQLTIDRIFLGHLSPDALGAAIASMGIFWVPMALVQQTAGFVTTFVAQYRGAKQDDRVGQALWQSIYISVVGGLLFLFLIPVTPWLFSLFKHSPQLIELETSYFQALCYSALPTALVACASGFYTGIERTKIIMRINGIGLVLNVLLDYIMIFGNWGCPALGVSGAGYATSIAGLGAAIYGFYKIFSPAYEKEFQVRTKWKPNTKLLWQFIKFGVPSGLQWSLEGLAFTCFLVFVGRMGSLELSATGITITIMMLSILPAMGVAQAVMALVGKHVGEKNFDQAQEYTWRGFEIVALYMSTLGISFVVFPSFYMNWFYNGQDELMWSQIQTVVPILLLFVALFALFDAVNLVLSFALKGAGDTHFVSQVVLVLPWPLMVIPTMFLVGVQHGLYWAWGAASLYIVTQAGFFLVRFIKGSWKSINMLQT